MVYTERGILKRSVSIMMTNFLKWKHDYRVWFVFLMEGFLVGQSMRTDSICTFYEEDGNSILASIFVF